MNLQYLRYIAQISTLGSINKAAQTLYVSQSTLSRAVQAVEEEAGITIFNRYNKGVTLTHEGEILLKRVNRIISELDELESDYAGHINASDDEQTLFLGEQRMTLSIEAYNRMYEKYYKKNEYLNVIIKEGSRQDILRAIGNDDVRLGLLYCTSNEIMMFRAECEALNLTYTILDQQPLCVQVGENHPLAGRETVNIRELSPYPRVAFMDEDVSGINYCADTQRLNTNIVKKRILVQERGSLREVLIGTESYYIGTWYRFNRAGTDRPVATIRCIPLEDYGIKIYVMSVHRTGRALSRMERRFIQELQGIIREEKESKGVESDEEAEE